MGTGDLEEVPLCEAQLTGDEQRIVISALVNGLSLEVSGVRVIALLIGSFFSNQNIVFF